MAEEFKQNEEVTNKLAASIEEIATSTQTVYEAVENTRGIDIVLDAHSHVIIDAEKVKNADGQEISVTQCGYFVQALGKLTIDENGNIESTLIQEYDEKDEVIVEALERETRFYEEILSKGGM